MCFALALAANAQQGPVLTDKDYQHAESFLTYGTEPFVDHGAVRPNWLPGDSFWYRALTANGSEFILVNTPKKTRSVAFDHQKLAAALSSATGQQYDASKLPFQYIRFSPDYKIVSFHVDDKAWKYDLQSNQVTPDTAKAPQATGGVEGGRRQRGQRGNDVLSPDGKRAAFIRDYNLWVRDEATKKETQLTFDGVENYGYATDNAGWKMSDAPILRWSPDSRKIATFKQDQRKVSDMYLVTTQVGKPTLKSWKYALPGDKTIAMIYRVIIDVDNAKLVALDVPADPHRAPVHIVKCAAA